MTDIDDGGPVYPQQDYIGDKMVWKSGLSKREFYAALAMQALMNPAHLAEVSRQAGHDVDLTAKVIARSAVMYADALVVALKEFHR